MNLESKTAHATATMRYTDSHVMVAVSRYRMQHRTRRLLTGLKVLIALPMAALAFAGFFDGAFGLGLFFVGVCFLLFFGHHIDFWWMRRSLRKWKFRDETIAVAFTDEGVHSESSKHEATLRWPSFTKAIHFHDGFLLLDGSRNVHWIPAASIVEPAGVAALERLLREKIAEHQVVKPCMAPSGALGGKEGPPAGEAGR